MTTAYELARELANTGDAQLIIDTLDELAQNWPSTYAAVAAEIKETLTWHED